MSSGSRCRKMAITIITTGFVSLCLFFNHSFYFYYERQVRARLRKALNAMPKRRTAQIGMWASHTAGGPSLLCSRSAGKLDLYVLSCSVVSDSLQPHGLKSAKLLCPWGFSRQEYWSGLPYPPPGVDLYGQIYFLGPGKLDV